MGLFTGLLTLPLAPVRGVVWIAEQLHEEALRQAYDPAVLRGQLAEVERARESGELSEEEAERIEADIVRRLLGRGPEPGPGFAPDSEPGSASGGSETGSEPGTDPGSETRTEAGGSAGAGT